MEMLFYIIWHSIEHIPNQLPALQVQPTQDYPKLDNRTRTRCNATLVTNRA